VPRFAVTSPSLQLDGVVVRRGGRRVLDGLSLRVEAGEAVALLGPNGAGKSTAFEVVAGLVPMDAGCVRLDGRAVERWPLHRRARAGLGYLPQGASAFPRLTVADNLRAVLELRRDLSRAARHRELAGLLRRFGLEAIADVRAEHVSGGERRRTELARLLASGPRVLVLDEPFAGLDPQGATDLAAHLRALIDGGATLLFSDHAVERALGLGHRVDVLLGGRVVVSGDSEAIRASEVARQGYWGGSP
jgi:lipopolysaccharide export system ATP-binding protein